MLKDIIQTIFLIYLITQLLFIYNDKNYHINGRLRNCDHNLHTLIDQFSEQAVSIYIFQLQISFEVSFLWYVGVLEQPIKCHS